MAGRVYLRDTALAQIVAHARADAPLECCGLLVGAGDTVERAVPARNLLASRTRFLIDPASHFDAIRSARAAGRAVIGAYHSHPAGGATPSPRDLEEASDPALIYVIVGLAGDRAPDVRGFRLEAGNFTACELVPLT
jgi:proteasome lid subunit RPN8/RPN11